MHPVPVKMCKMPIHDKRDDPKKPYRTAVLLTLWTILFYTKTVGMMGRTAKLVRPFDINGGIMLNCLSAEQVVEIRAAPLYTRFIFPCGEMGTIEVYRTSRAFKITVVSNPDGKPMFIFHEPGGTDPGMGESS